MLTIRNVTVPSTPLNEFDPGAYLSGLEFDETDTPISEADRDALAQFVHLLAFMALKGQSPEWASSVVAQGSQAHQALESHFGHLNGWQQVPSDGLPYRQLANFLMQPYPPRQRTK